MISLFKNIQILLTALCGITLVLSFFDFHLWMPYFSVAFGSYYAIGASWDAIKQRILDVNFLMVFAAAGAIAVGYVVDAAALLFLFSLSSTLESMAFSKTKSAIEGLIKLRPDKAIRIRGDQDEEVPVEDLKLDDCVRILPYQQVPADGVILQGQGSLDEGVMTGESAPIEKGAEDFVYAGTQNLDGMLIIQVTAEVKDTLLEKIVRRVEEAQGNKASGERISTWFGQKYTFFVFGCFAVSMIIRSLVTHQFHNSFYESLTLLVALSPCALVISTPASTLSALAYAARRGILVRGGQYIEEAGKVKSVVLDKTGTLTEGKLNVEEICVQYQIKPMNGPAFSLKKNSFHACGQLTCELCTCITCWHEGEEMVPETIKALQLAAAAEKDSTHPIANAILRCARSLELEVPEVLTHTAHPGLGVKATIEGIQVQIGQPRFFEHFDRLLPLEFRRHVEEMQERGLTSIMLYYTGNWAAFGVRDRPRAEAKEFIKQLKKEHISRIVMMTGDNPKTAKVIADEVGIDEVYASLMPQDKAHLMKEKMDDGQGVMMVGDGVNDAIGLAKASIGVAMGGLGSDVALNAADVVLVQDKLERILDLMKLGKRTNIIIRTNLFFAAGVIVTLTVSSLALNLPLPLAVVGHEGSTVLVILNGLRLLNAPKGTL